MAQIKISELAETKSAKGATFLVTDKNKASRKLSFKDIMPNTIGSVIPIHTGGKAMFVGASFTEPNNGWVELACSKLGITCINQAVGGSIIIENVADRMMDANESQPHGSLFMVNGVDIFPEVEVFVIMHTHMWDVYLEESKSIDYYKQNGFSTGDTQRAEAFDYVIQQYKQWCAEYTRTIQIQGQNDVIGSKDCNILLCSHWHQSRDIYNESSRKLAIKFGLSYCAFDENIGFSNKSFIKSTLNTDANTTPTEGTYHESILHSAYTQLNGEGKPIGKTETAYGVTYGWHPVRRSTTNNYGYHQEADGYYYPAIQYKLCAIFMECIKVI